MPSLRPEIEAFVRAAQTLIVMNIFTLPFTEEEERVIAYYAITLHEHFVSPER